MADFKAGDKVVLKIDLGAYHEGDVVTLQPVRNLYNVREFDWSAEVNGEHVFHVHNSEIGPYRYSKEERLTNLEVTVDKLEKLVAGLRWDTADAAPESNKSPEEEFADYPVEYIHTDANGDRFVKVSPDSWVWVSNSSARGNISYVYRDKDMANR